MQVGKRRIVALAVALAAFGAAASTPAGALSAETGVVGYVIDASGSTSAFGGTCGDLNGDGTADTVLDCEIAGLLALHQSVLPYPSIEVGAVGFGADATEADVSPLPGYQPLTAPAADKDEDGKRDLEEVATSLVDGVFNDFAPVALDIGGTNFDAALSELNELAALTAKDTQAAFLSDGDGATYTTGPGSPLQSSVDAGIEVDVFSIGMSSVGCAADTSLRQIADATGGSCVEVTDVSQIALLPPPCEGKQANLVGTSGVDTLNGSGAADVAAALAGADKVLGGAGNDLLCGGSENDVLKGGPGRDTLVGGPGNDTCRGGPGRDRLKSC